MTRFGVEEEFVLVDGETLVPLALDGDARERLVGAHHGGTISPEYLTSQIETATAPLSTIAEASEQLRGLRSTLARHVSGRGAIAAATGTPFLASPHPEILSLPHYDAVADILGEISRGHEVNGLHVHVEMPSDEERVRALDRARAWMPVLLALTGNSPFARGRSTGFASWRSVVIRRLPTAWTPPHVYDHSDYRARVDALLALGGITEESSLGWTIRLSARFPTVEVRVCDAQLDVDDTLLVAALCRAILTSEDLDGGPEIGVDAVDASLWTAARYGMSARVVDPTTGDAAPAEVVAGRMLSRLVTALDEQDDTDFVTTQLARIRRDGSGAHRQRRAVERLGVAGLRDLYRSTTAPHPSRPQ
ncbi:YbdK family carboxylate-amine ligase [Microbacterium sp. NPDC089696]|uniref:carboxylate-amine ligase n=1 Tax=Microbacterium sp. NPDC089696 TaxID=3364199 RepID=UPI0037F43CE8